MNLIEIIKSGISSLFKKKPQIHLYALTWNDEKMLPHFFNHYDKIVNAYFIFDNNSRDNTAELIRANRKATLDTIEVQGNSFVEFATLFYNKVWKKSRGKADWVIICNIDEFFYHEKGFRNYLKKAYSEGYTMIQSEGFEMIAENFPDDYSKKIYESVQFGTKSQVMSKQEIFNPNKIIEINFLPGRHSHEATGEVKVADGCKLLHFKYIGMEYWLPRQNELKQGLREKDIENQWGHQYLWEDDKKIKFFEDLKKNAEKVV